MIGRFAYSAARGSTRPRATERMHSTHAAERAQMPEPVPRRNWTPPALHQLPPPEQTDAPVRELAGALVGTLRDLEIPGRLVRTVEGPATIAFELTADEGVRMRDFTRLGTRDDLAYALGAPSVRIQAPIPGRSVVGIEIPSPCPRAVALSETAPYAAAPLRACLGITPERTPVTLDLATLPHLAIAGASGSGKSSLIHALVCSLLMNATPDDLALVMVDVKLVELSQYARLPHLVAPVVTDVSDAIRTLEGLVDEVQRRYTLLREHEARDIIAYNRTAPAGHLPSVLCVIDELAELMLRSPKRVEAAITRLGQLGRACGVHLVLATQSPHREILTGLVKANVPARIALRVASGVHSRVALDQTGAEQLLGNGDALLQDGRSVRLHRFQSAYVDETVVATIIEHWHAQAV